MGRYGEEERKGLGGKRKERGAVEDGKAEGVMKRALGQGYKSFNLGTLTECGIQYQGQ